MPPPVLATHYTRQHNHTGIKNNTRTKEVKIDMACSKPRMTEQKNEADRRIGGSLAFIIDA